MPLAQASYPALQHQGVKHKGAVLWRAPSDQCFVVLMSMAPAWTCSTIPTLTPLCGVCLLSVSTKTGSLDRAELLAREQWALDGIKAHPWTRQHRRGVTADRWNSLGQARTWTSLGFRSLRPDSFITPGCRLIAPVSVGITEG